MIRMNKKSSKLLLLLILSALAFGLIQETARAQGGPPMLTDDPGTPGNHRWEINTAFTMERSISGKEFEAPLLDINFGLGQRIQLKLEVPYRVIQEDGEKTKKGTGSFEFGVKWRFLDEERHGVSVSTYPQFEYKPAASIRRGINDRGNELLLPIEVMRKVGPVDVNVEFGYRIEQHDKDELLYGIAVGREVTKRLELAAEIHGEPNRDFRKDDRVVNFGARYRLNRHYTLLFSAGRSLRHATSDGALNLVMYGGLQFTR